MEWSSSEDITSTKSKPSANNTKLKRSMSTIGLVGTDSQNLTLREARSCTGALEEFKYSDSCTNDSIQMEHNCHELLYKEPSRERGLETREISSNQIFIVQDNMLMYRGKRYSYNDIAILWKKDCRMWLWKSKLYRKRNKSLGELRDKLHNIKI